MDSTTTNGHKFNECSKFCLVEKSLNCLPLFSNFNQLHGIRHETRKNDVCFVNTDIHKHLYIFFFSSKYASSFTLAKISHIWTYLFLSFWMSTQNKKKITQAGKQLIRVESFFRLRYSQCFLNYFRKLA